MAISSSSRCIGAFVGHVQASNYDPSIHLASTLGESLLQHNTLQPTDVFSRYLTVYHTNDYPLGNVMKIIYDVASNVTTSSSSQRKLFDFDQATIDGMVRTTDTQMKGLTAACGPAHRSFPLAFCPHIADGDLFELSKKEAALTHQSSIAGEVAGIVNKICRGLIREKAWHNAISEAFTMSRLHEDLAAAGMRYTRWSDLSKPTHAAYAPAALVAALDRVSNSVDLNDALQKAGNGDKTYYLPLVGILAGARWGVSNFTYANVAALPKIQPVLETASRLGNLWFSGHAPIRV